MHSGWQGCWMIVLLASAAACQGPTGAAPCTCDTGQACDGEGECRQLCMFSDDCFGADTCVGGLCLPNQALAPSSSPTTPTNPTTPTTPTTPTNPSDPSDPTEPGPPAGPACATHADCPARVACESAGQCVAGACVYQDPSASAACDDGNPCTTDTCGLTGCTHSDVPNGAACASDGTFCNGPEVCSAGQCIPSGDPCPGRCVEATKSCGSCGVDSDCPGDTATSWTTCSGFDSVCDEAGTQSRTVTDFSCTLGQCVQAQRPENRTCSRATAGQSCGADVVGAWGSCGAYADSCDETGSQQRNVTSYVCSAGACGSSGRLEAQACTRSTSGASCGAESWAGTCGQCVPTQGCNLLGVGSESGADPTCGGGSCQSVANSRPCRCPAQSCDGEQAVFSMPDLYDQWTRGDTPARLGAVGAQGTTGIVFWQVHQTSLVTPTASVSAKTGFTETTSLTLSPSSGALATAAQMGHDSVGLWLNSCSPGVSAKDTIQPLVIHHDFASPLRPFLHPNPIAGSPSAPPAPYLPQLDHPELAFRLEATMPTLEAKGGAVAYSAAVLRFRDTSKAPPAGQPAHYYDFWVSVQLADSRGAPQAEGVIGDACATCSGLPIVITAPSGLPGGPSRYGHRWPGTADFAGAAYAGFRAYDYRISQDEFQRMLADVAAFSPRGFSTNPADYALVHLNINPEVYDPTPATTTCNPSTEAAYGRIGMTVRKITVSQVSWSKIPHVLFRGANASPQWGMQVFFDSTYAPGWDEAKSFFAPLPNHGGTVTLRFNTLANPKWRGSITGLRVDPFSVSDAWWNMDRFAVYGLGGAGDQLAAEECTGAVPFPAPWTTSNVDGLWADPAAENNAGYWGGRSTGIDPILLVDLTAGGGLVTGR